MTSLLLPKLSTADGTYPSCIDTEMFDDASLTASEDDRRDPPPTEDIPVDASASNFADWVSMVFRPTQLRTLWSDPSNAPSVFLSNAEARFVRQIHADLGDLPVRIRQSPAAELCRKFTHGVGLELANKPGNRVAAFEDEEDMITIVAHCQISKRQASFEFHADGITIGIVSIDERMHRTERKCRIHQIGPILGAIAWLIHRP
ncbi:MAG: hypothetical protein ABIG44_03810 [Planctomycetota bacterium]